MKRHLVLAFGLALCGLAGTARAQSSWIFRPSEFTHSPETNLRVARYAPPVTPVFRGDDTYRQSAYRHNQSSIRAGNSADHLHIVETWGAGESIRPYGEWLFPYRAGATPYGPWGNPQGPWTTPFGSWSNPFALGQLPIPPWVQNYYPSYPNQGPGPAPTPGPGPAPMPAPTPGPSPAPTPTPSPTP